MMNMSILAALAGMIFVARSTASGPFDGVGWELDAIAAVFIGGAAVTGGVGTVVGSIIGGLVMAVLNNGLQLMGIGADATQMIKGLVLLVAVAFDVYNKSQGRPSHHRPAHAQPSDAEGRRRRRTAPTAVRGHGDQPGDRDHPPVRLSPRPADTTDPVRRPPDTDSTRVPPGRDERKEAHAYLRQGAGSHGGGRPCSDRLRSAQRHRHERRARPPAAPRPGFPANAVIGVALPQKTSENWVLAEQLFNDGLSAAGFQGDVQFANGGVSEQQNQISAMVTKGAKVIVVGAIDGSQLGTQLKAAKDAGATVIAYDRLVQEHRRPSTTTSPTTTSRSASCRARPCSTA